MDGYWVGWVLVGGLVGLLIGQFKGRGFVGALVGAFLGPIGWLLIAVGPNHLPSYPYRKGRVPPGAVKCKHCASRIPRCPACNRQVGIDRPKKYRHCGERLPAARDD